MLCRFFRITLILGTIFTVFYLYLPPKSELIQTMSTTVGKNHVDILCVGSSHMYKGINPIQMYEERGYAAYTIGCGAMSPWQCYYNIKKACDDQSPSLIICDTYMLGITQDISDYEDSNTVENMLNTPLSFDKIRAVMKSSADSRLSILLRFPYIYDDYDEFTGFTGLKLIGVEDYSMGYMPETKVEGYKGAPYLDITEEISPISAQNEESLRDIIEYCQDKGINLLLVNAPSMVIDEKTQPYYNYIGKIARENGIPFIDGNRYQDEMDIDWARDTGDGGAHLNHSGVTKFTSFIVQYVDEYQDVTDRRQDDEYAEYDCGIEWLKNECPME